MVECLNIGEEKPTRKIQFRKVRRFTGTKKSAKCGIFLQYKEEGFPWEDVMEVSLNIRDGWSNYPWESEKDENLYQKAVEYERLKGW
jgi:hypothetical protein